MPSCIGKDLEQEIYWCVKNEFLKWRRHAAPNAHANWSIDSNQQLVEVQAYTIQKLAEGHKLGDVDWSQSDKLEEQIRCLVQSMCMSHLQTSNGERPCGVKSKMSIPRPSKLMTWLFEPEPSEPRTAQQVFDKVIDDVISRGVPQVPVAVEPKSQNSGSSNPKTTKQNQKLLQDQIMSEATGEDEQRQHSGLCDELLRGKNRSSRDMPDESDAGVPNTTTTSHRKPQPSELRTAQQVFDKVVDDIISRGVPKLPVAVEPQSQKLGSSKNTKTKQIRKLPHDQIMSEAAREDEQRQHSGLCDKLLGGKNKSSRDMPNDSDVCVSNKTTASNRKPQPSELRTAEQVFDKVIDDVISWGVPKVPVAVEPQSRKVSSSTTKQIQRLVHDQISEAVGDEAQGQQVGLRDGLRSGKNSSSREMPDESAFLFPNTTMNFHRKSGREHWAARVRRCVVNHIKGPKPASISPHETSE